MIQSQKSRGPQLHAPCLDIYLPIYCKFTSEEIESIFTYIFNGVRQTDFLQTKSERWLIKAYKELREAECLAARWLDMDLSQLYACNLKGLSDFALLTYASIVQERDCEEVATESSLKEERRNTGWQRMIAAYYEILIGVEGTDLVNYSWLYRDMHGYQMVQDEDVFNLLLEKMISYDLAFGLSAHVVDSLSIAACEWIRFGRFEEGSSLLTQLFETQPIPFFVYERVAVTFANLKHREWLSLLFNGLSHASEQSTHAADALRKVQSLVVFDASPISPRTNAERRFLKAIRTIHSASTQPIRALAHEALPHLPSVPVKQIPKL
ncbi:MAG: hypothetical protein JXX29_24120 [Deltaproteobacteria bacterium]|nr:hypothetical protein [Deltaproteobacteria bacterium]MBN2674790.1 hypothetical protein [Deltaproteobacteria bacterium]